MCSRTGKFGVPRPCEIVSELARYPSLPIHTVTGSQPETALKPCTETVSDKTLCTIVKGTTYIGAAAWVVAFGNIVECLGVFVERRIDEPEGTLPSCATALADLQKFSFGHCVGCGGYAHEGKNRRPEGSCKAGSIEQSRGRIEERSKVRACWTYQYPVGADHKSVVRGNCAYRWQIHRAKPARRIRDCCTRLLEVS